MSPLVRAFVVMGGMACVALGVIGMFLPVLPTTPFLLAAAFLFARSSRRCHEWLTTNRLCGRYIRNYREGRGITRRHKTISLVLLWLTIGSSAIFAVASSAVRLLLGAVAVGVTIHIVRIRTFRPAPHGPDGSPVAPGRNPASMASKSCPKGERAYPEESCASAEGGRGGSLGSEDDEALGHEGRGV